MSLRQASPLKAWRTTASPAAFAGSMVAATAVLVMVAHASLLPLGAWFPDEYVQFAYLHRFGWGQVVDRVLGWSPRPISEALLFAYATVVASLDQPAVAWILAASWAGFLVTILLASRLARLGMVLPLALAAATLLVARPGEMWYWPAAALAYVSALAGLCAASFLVAGGERGRGIDGALCAALLLAAGSVEVGAIAVLLICAAQLVRHSLGGWMPRLAPEQAVWVWLPPLLLAACVMGGLLATRVGSAGEVFAPGGPAGDTWGSLGAASERIFRVIGMVPGSPDLRPTLQWGIPVKLAFLAGFWALLPSRAVSASQRLTLMIGAAAMLATAFASMVVAYRQFGVLCCPRHETFRQALVVLALLLLAASLPRSGGGRFRPVAMLALAGAFLVMFLMRVPALRYDLALLPQAYEARAANWAAGRAPADGMTFVAEPIGRITGGWRLEPGVYRREDRSMAMPGDMNWHAFAIMLFFEKLELRSP